MLAEWREVNLEPNYITSDKGLRKKCAWAGAVDFFTVHVTEAIGVGVEAHRSVEGGFAASEPETDMGISTTGGCSGG